MGKLASMNENFFDEINEYSAYVMGLIWADGCLTIDDNYRRVSIYNTDLDLLNKVADAMEWKGNINKTGSCYRLGFSNSRPIDKLIEYGLVEKKSNITRFPSLPNDMVRHFIRGYFDGDGHFSYELRNSNKRRMVSGFTCGSKEFAIVLIDKLHELGLSKAKLCHRGRDNGGSYQIRYYVRDTKKLYKLMYKDATIYMDRKKRYYDERVGSES